MVVHACTALVPILFAWALSGGLFENRLIDRGRGLPAPGRAGGCVGLR